MDIGIIAAIVLLIVWAIGALVIQGPGYIHLLLTIGVSLLIYRIVVRSANSENGPPAK
jgi:hypothetical protein